MTTVSISQPKPLRRRLAAAVIAPAASMAVAVAVAMSCLQPAHAQGIPVFDASNLVQAVTQVISWRRQLEAMREQFGQAEAQFRAITGRRGFGSLLSDPRLQAYLPPEARTALEELGRIGALSARAQQLRGQPIYECAGTATERAACQRQFGLVYERKAQSMAAFDAALAKADTINGLIAAIDRTDDAKAVGELQARLQGEALVLQNETTRLQVLTQLGEIERQLAAQQRQEQELKRVTNPVRSSDRWAPMQFR